MKITRQLSLVKAEQRFVFRYEAGSEADVISVFAELATDTTCDFDWFDAAALSFKLTRSLISQADELISDKVKVSKG